jgi:hypothetical protein
MLFLIEIKNRAERDFKLAEGRFPNGAIDQLLITAAAKRCQARLSARSGR